jgi:hypothetical protein
MLVSRYASMNLYITLARDMLNAHKCLLAEPKLRRDVSQRRHRCQKALKNVCMYCVKPTKSLDRLCGSTI